MKNNKKILVGAIMQLYALSIVLPIRNKFWFKINEEENCIDIFRKENYKSIKEPTKNGYCGDFQIYAPIGYYKEWVAVDAFHFYDSSVGYWNEKELKGTQTFLQSFFAIIESEAISTLELLQLFRERNFISVRS